MAASAPLKALEVARRIDDPWFRCQALAAVAFVVEEDRVDAIGREALKAAWDSKDDYQRGAVAAWPIAAPVARKRLDAARRAYEKARVHALAASPPGSVAEALTLLLQGAFGLGPHVGVQIAEDLVDLRRREAYWRVDRAVLRTVALVAGTDPARERALAARIADERLRRRVLVALDGPDSPGPRPFQ